MNKVKCYSLDVPYEEFFEGSCTVPDAEKMELPCRCRGFLGVNPDYQNSMVHYLFDSPKHRNHAYNFVRRKMLCFINLQTAYVDKQYIKGANGYV